MWYSDAALSRGRLAAAIVLFATIGQNAASAQGAEILTNDAVVQMVTGKLPKDLILAKIGSTMPAFELTAGGLIALTQNKVPEDILKAMVARASAASASPSAAARDEVIRNEDVVAMVVARVPKPIVLSKINNTPNAFDLSATGLVGLNGNKVPKDLIKAMMAPLPTTAHSEEAVARPLRSADGRPAGNTAAASTTPPKPRSTRPAAPIASLPAEPGIYLYAKEGARLTFQLLEPMPYTAARTEGKLLQSITGGISKARIKASVRGESAAITTTDANAEFYFIFEVKQTNLSGAGPWMGAQVTSPNQFSLARLEVKANSREVSVAAANAFGQEVGTDAKATIDFTLVRLKAGAYRVVPRVVLTPGQYAFITNVGLEAEKDGRLFDFGVAQ